MTDEPTTPEPEKLVAKLMDDAKAPEFFASFIAGAAFDGPNIRLTFASNRVDHTTTPGPINQVVNVRIVMSVMAAANLYQFLGDMLAKAQLNATTKPADQKLS